MKYVTLFILVLAVVAVLLAIWTPFLWQALITAVFLFLLAAGIHGNTGGRGLSGQ